jgi:hypothetical protein
MTIAKRSVFAMTLVLGAACGSSVTIGSPGGGSGDDCVAAVSKLEGCVGGGTVSGTMQSCTGVVDCEARCINAASCSDITAPMPGSTYTTCIEACGGESQTVTTAATTTVATTGPTTTTGGGWAGGSGVTSTGGAGGVTATTTGAGGGAGGGMPVDPICNNPMMAASEVCANCVNGLTFSSPCIMQFNMVCAASAKCASFTNCVATCENGSGGAGGAGAVCNGMGGSGGSTYQCDICCQTDYAAGAAIYTQAIVDACICAPGAPCAAACAM